MEENNEMLPLTTAMDPEPVTRPSSTSTNGSLPHMPGMTALANAGSLTESPQMRTEQLSPTQALAADAPQQHVPQQQQQQQQQPQPTQQPPQPVHQPAQQPTYQHTGPAPTPTVVSGNQASTVVSPSYSYTRLMELPESFVASSLCLEVYFSASHLAGTSMTAYRTHITCIAVYHPPALASNHITLPPNMPHPREITADNLDIPQKILPPLIKFICPYRNHRIASQTIFTARSLATPIAHPTLIAMMATPANNGRDMTQPTCQNCQTSTTPLWRRDEYGSVLCNACGLFLKLHGRPRPISLKTDVIKSRNRVKTMRPDLATKKKQQQQAQQAAQQAQAANNFANADANNFDLNAQLGGLASAASRQGGQQGTNGHGDGTNSPHGASLYNPAMTAFHGLDDPQFHGFNMSGTSPNRPASPLNGERNSDAPQTHEQLIAENSALKTRVSELEVINGLFRGRLGQLEQDEANARRGQEISGQAEAQLRQQLDDSHRMENVLKRRLDELELELQAAKATAAGDLDFERAAKRPRLSEPVEDNQDQEMPAPMISDELEAPPMEEPATEDVKIPMPEVHEAPADDQTDADAATRAVVEAADAADEQTEAAAA